ncbi:MAG: glycosyltransferase family 2 protein [Bacteroidales bacterium]|nr:glycosyltransferase family 2 protein [Bacteroidales bacterium]
MTTGNGKNLTAVDLTLVIPCFNEQDTLPEVLPDLIKFCRQRDWKILIVDDGSTDNSKGILEKFIGETCLKVIYHKVNRGYGGAIKSGIIHCDTEYIITIDADNQHYLSDIEKLVNVLINSDADMVIGSRKGQKNASFLRRMGKGIIRNIARFLMKLEIYDINSGMKLYRTDLAKKYYNLCPDSMAYSDIIALVFIYFKHLVIEEPISIKERKTGKSTIGVNTALQTLMEILNIIVLFNPMKIFLTLSIVFIVSGLAWGIPIVLNGRGISTGSLLALNTGLLFFILGLIAEQLSKIRKNLN